MISTAPLPYSESPYKDFHAGIHVVRLSGYSKDELREAAATAAAACPCSTCKDALENFGQNWLTLTMATCGPSTNEEVRVVTWFAAAVAALQGGRG